VRCSRPKKKKIFCANGRIRKTVEWEKGAKLESGVSGREGGNHLTKPSSSEKRGNTPRGWGFPKEKESGGVRSELHNH